MKALLDAEKEDRKNERGGRDVARMPVKAALKRSRRMEKKERRARPLDARVTK